MPYQTSKCRSWRELFEVEETFLQEFVQAEVRRHILSFKYLILISTGSLKVILTKEGIYQAMREKDPLLYENDLYLIAACDIACHTINNIIKYLKTGEKIEDDI